MENKLNTVPEDLSQDFIADTDDDISLCNFAISGYEHDDVVRSPRASNASDGESFEFFHEVNEYRKRDYLCLKSASFHKARGFEWDDYHEEGRELTRSGSNRCRPKTNSPIQKVNITALTDMSAKSRRRMFMFGPVKFKPEMDVEAIRKRRSRLGPVNIPPMPEETEMKMVKSGGGRGKSGGGVGDGGMLRPLWCRSHLATALAKSFGCVSASMV
ncbi:hypothetical protein RHGRI_027446 [Rhododendron griersonianum]|uniref:Uncharacterized protein n=1 Tax=Rhododendron griersonianum TaxID=479676 RepID=A0AAV6J038_9ERIC|nr:hypothetical protein RHGRI_027446 [Rhododendron griersonianum]